MEEAFTTDFPSSDAAAPEAPDMDDLNAGGLMHKDADIPLVDTVSFFPFPDDAGFTPLLFQDAVHELWFNIQVAFREGAEALAAIWTALLSLLKVVFYFARWVYPYIQPLVTRIVLTFREMDPRTRNMTFLAMGVTAVFFYCWRRGFVQRLLHLLITMAPYITCLLFWMLLRFGLPPQSLVYIRPAASLLATVLMPAVLSTQALLRAPPAPTTPAPQRSPQSSPLGILRGRMSTPARLNKAATSTAPATAPSSRDIYYALVFWAVSRSILLVETIPFVGRLVDRMTVWQDVEIVFHLVLLISVLFNDHLLLRSIAKALTLTIDTFVRIRGGSGGGGPSPAEVLFDNVGDFMASGLRMLVPLQISWAVEVVRTGWVQLFLAFIFFWTVYPLIYYGCLILGTLYPIYRTLSILEGQTYSAQTRWLEYWVAYALIDGLFESSWRLPLKYRVKLFLILGLQLPAIRGSQKIFKATMQLFGTIKPPPTPPALPPDQQRHQQQQQQKRTNARASLPPPQTQSQQMQVQARNGTPSQGPIEEYTELPEDDDDDDHRRATGAGPAVSLT
ncbi:unnamed protein product [Vitrella brassicaformis CCMP3155]|uniref:Uncharacterized protein n=4 Tax=Vitrella brassicaformis TaxID=1169539 RepID=A0A0G4GGF1_VITBC|nr:unnamed protein product [Vitrella brassicaformis CCMP3155]|eukprot:CEM28700.1 unnamed protein product [Vitrella brassicaformis CCMP3155]